MAQQECVSGLLLVNISGLTQDSGLLSRLNLSKKKTDVVVKRGELVTPLVSPAVKRDGTTPGPHNYQLEGNPAITLNCGHKDIAVVSDHEFQLLKAISQKEERLRVYTEGLLEWGAELKPSNPVYVSLSNADWYSHTVKIVVAGVVRYVGPVKRQPGIQFGVEIVDQDYRGWGSSSGDQYFSCDHNCAMFVSLDKLHSPSTTAVQERSRENDVDPSTLGYERAVVVKTTMPDPNEQCRELEDYSLHRMSSQLELHVAEGEGVYDQYQKEMHHAPAHPPESFEQPSQDLQILHESNVQGFQQPHPQQPPFPPQQGRVHSDLGVQSRIQLPSIEPEHPHRYGVIRWIGSVPEVQGLIAGIELDEEMQGCTNGTLVSTGQKFFSCAPGKGMYYPLSNLAPDERFSTQGANYYDNPLRDAPLEELEDQHISGGEVQRYVGDERGIQGHQNSCYLDATVFGLFALSDAFDDMFLTESEDLQRSEISYILQKGIVNPLRKHGLVRFESVMKLRDKLEEFGKMKGITQDEKDPEEFLNMLVKHTLQVAPFISIKRPFGVEEEYFVQLFMEPDESLKLPSVDALLAKMFREQSISFTEVPSKLLIQVPRFGKQFKTFEKIIPEISVNVAELMDIPPHQCFVCDKPAKKLCHQCQPDVNIPGSDIKPPFFCDACWRTFHDHSKRQGHVSEWCDEVKDLYQVSELELLSVICIETSHYVCFTRSEDKWVFFDSMANRVYDKFNIPKVADCTDVLNEWVYPAGGDRSRLLNTAT